MLNDVKLEGDLHNQSSSKYDNATENNSCPLAVTQKLSALKLNRSSHALTMVGEHDDSDCSNEIKSLPLLPLKGSWASLLKNLDGNQENLDNSSPKDNQKGTLKAGDLNGSTMLLKDIWSLSPEEFVLMLVKEQNTPILYSKGLINHGNTCFMNAVLQSLMHATYFLNFLIFVTKSYSIRDLQNSPILDSFVSLLDYFRIEPPHTMKPGKYSKSNTQLGNPLKWKQSSGSLPKGNFEAKIHFDVQENLTTSFLEKLKGFHQEVGAQEDAHEFLCYLLDALSEEMIGIMPKHSKDLADQSSPPESSQSQLFSGQHHEWQEAGNTRKMKSVSRTTITTESPLSQLFLGTFKSTVKTGKTKNSITYEPFRFVQLDVQHADSVEEALRHVCLTEKLLLAPNQSISRQSLFQSLPSVLILHLKRFVYNTHRGSIDKVDKHLSVPLYLNFSPAWMASSFFDTDSLGFKLFAVIDHHGNDVDDGHYTCFVTSKHEGYIPDGSFSRSADLEPPWIYFDDEDVSYLSVDNVLAKRKVQVPYLLFYERIYSV